MDLLSGRTPLSPLVIPSFSSISSTTISTFSRTRKPSISAISIRPLFSPTPLLPPTPGQWHPSRLGYFFFTFNNGSFKACQGSQKLAIKVRTSSSSSSSEEASPPAPQPQGSANAPMESALGPSSGGEVSSSPTFPWPFRPGQAPAQSPSGTVPLVPEKSGGSNGMPFINSNPAVPLPTGEVDSATIRPLPTSSALQGQIVMNGPFGFHIVVHSIVTLLLLLLL
ncbi:PREDICTED: leucine-rich repeat extensin-like protein 5 isoform X4 [Lupinus angustifolius]|uniref:leucine-rich repeat extensin-like protein 5 isoform X4 n=1 Tax=Lupinus angustifolius TaxID=3871 RepID=UPI00092E5360|nr:PREDICTED: leucine-rich repeat extensin-like protein 5 isoform X4 [Lupinus angustifolius]